MRLRERAALVVLIGGALAPVPSLDGQVPPPRDASQELPGPRQLAANLRAQVVETGGPMYGVLPALLQLRREYPDTELDALADSMVAIAWDYHSRGDAQAADVVGAVRHILTTAMIWRETNGVRYAGARDRVVSLAERLEGGEGTLWSLIQIPDRAEALEHVRRFAIADYPAAAEAVAILANEAFGGPAGLAILRGLYDQALVADPIAAQRLDELATAQGWR